MNSVGLVLLYTGRTRIGQLQGAVVDKVGEAAVDGHLEDGKGETAAVDGHLRLGAVGNELFFGAQSHAVRAQAVHMLAGIVEDHRVLALVGRLEVVQCAGGGDGRHAAGR